MNKTIAKVGYAMLTETTEGKITYDKVKWFKSDKAGGRTVGAEPSGESTTVYADGLPVIVANNNAGYNISLELIAIVDDLELRVTSIASGSRALISSFKKSVSSYEKPVAYVLIVYTRLSSRNWF